MENLSLLFVGKPLSVLAVAVVLVSGYLALRSGALGAGRRPRPLLVAAVAWALYAGWEQLVCVQTPEANIRVDLLVIWPALAILTVWAILRTFR